MITAVEVEQLERQLREARKNVQPKGSDKVMTVRALDSERELVLSPRFSLTRRIGRKVESLEAVASELAGRMSASVVLARRIKAVYASEITGAQARDVVLSEPVLFGEGGVSRRLYKRFRGEVLEPLDLWTLFSGNPEHRKFWRTLEEKRR